MKDTQAIRRALETIAGDRAQPEARELAGLCVDLLDHIEVLEKQIASARDDIDRLYRGFDED